MHWVEELVDKANALQEKIWIIRLVNMVLFTGLLALVCWLAYEFSRH